VVPIMGRGLLPGRAPTYTDSPPPCTLFQQPARALGAFYNTDSVDPHEGVWRPRVPTNDLDTFRDHLPHVFRDQDLPPGWDDDWIFVPIEDVEATLASDVEAPALEGTTDLGQLSQKNDARGDGFWAQETLARPTVLTFETPPPCYVAAAVSERFIALNCSSVLLQYESGPPVLIAWAASN
jgi:hypothetical protein